MPGNFTRENGDEVEVDYMFIQNNIQYARIDDMKATMLVLPYIDKRFEMLIFKPDVGKYEIPLSDHCCKVSL